MIKRKLNILSIKYGNILFVAALLFCYYIIRSVYGISDYVRNETLSLGFILASVLVINILFSYKVLGTPKIRVVGDYYIIALLFSLYLIFHLFFSSYFNISEIFSTTAALLISTSLISVRCNIRLNNYIAIFFFVVFTYYFVYYRLIEPRVFSLANNNEDRYPQFLNSIYYLLCLLPFFLTYKWKYVPIIIAFFCVLISFKIGSITGLFAGLVAYFIVNQKVQEKKINKTFWIILTLFILFIFLYNKVSSNFDFDIMQKIDEDDGTGSGRIGIWGKVLSLYFSSSLFGMLFGHGPNAVSDAITFSAHNDFLEVLYDFGLIGEILYLRFIYVLGKYMILLIKRKSEQAAPFAYSLFLFISMSLISNVIFISRYSLILFAFWGMAMGQSRLQSIGKSKI